ncbi:hypothetical protein AO385_0713 [Moraxella catarrhalis]|nr:hypothetical protein AO385_0713 [Moraxella catarrhalis]
MPLIAIEILQIHAPAACRCALFSIAFTGAVGISDIKLAHDACSYD